MNLEKRIRAFTTLGDFLSQFKRDGFTKNDNIPHTDLFFDGLKHQLTLAYENNGWFTPDNLHFSLESWSELLNQDHLEQWASKYELDKVMPKTVAVVMAGNIPLVGFHDFLSVLITGHHILVKQSSNDKHLLPYLAKYLEHVEPEFKGKIQFNEGKLDNYDAVIATGSDNTARYFEHYFKDKTSIIRKNRNSVVVLSGTETEAQLGALSEDIFRYFGLGCRSISKAFVPKGYDFDALFNAIYHWHTIINDQKYANNYDYNKAVYLMSEFDFLENGFFMIKEDPSYASPIATLFYEYYEDADELRKKLKKDNDKLQCIVADGFVENEVSFGQTQQPQLWQYADHIDTVNFLLKI